jgi:hypothetical protein
MAVELVRAAQPGAWHYDDRGYADVPLTAPLTDRQIAEQFPTLRIRPGDTRPTSAARSVSTSPCDAMGRHTRRPVYRDALLTRLGGERARRGLRGLAGDAGSGIGAESLAPERVDRLAVPGPMICR